MRLHIVAGSPNCRKVQAVVASLELDVGVNVMDIQRGEHRQPKYMALNPNGLTPILEDGEFVLWESNAIAQYLASGSSLFPENARIQADISRWQFWESAHYGKAAGDLVWENFAKPHFTGEASNPDTVADALARYRKFADVLDRHLEGKDFVLGGELTIADFTLASHAAYLEPAQIPYQGFINIAAWYKRLDNIDTWRQSAPPKEA